MKTQIEILKELKIQIRGNLGQHLLIDPNIQQKIVDLLLLEPGECFLEIGPGLGSLTGWMLQRGASVLAVEKDPRFVQALKEIFPEEVKSGRLKIENTDILEFDMENISSRFGCGIRQVVSNLPYYITGPILAKMLPLKMFRRAVFMMQKEVADRIFAKPGGREYGRLSLLVSFYSKARHAFDVSPGCFTPPPEVHSSVVVFDYHKNVSKEGQEGEKTFLELVKTSFAQRRKKLLSSLAQRNPWGLKRAAWENLFQKMAIPLDARPETLSPEDFIKLSRELNGLKPAAG